MREETVQSSVIWGTLLTAVIRVGQVLVSLVLVRLLTPEIYGQFGLLSAVLTGIYVLSMQRFMEYSFYQGKDELRQDMGMQLGFGLVLHLGLFVVLNIVATALGFVERYAVIEPYLRLASVGILLNVPRFYYSTLLQRQMRWRRIRGLHFVSFVLSSACAVYLAWQGYGLWSLVIHALLVPVPYVLDSLSVLRDVKMKLPDRQFMPVLRFGVVRSTTAAVTAAQGLLESGVLVLIVGFGTFGLFGRAIALSSLLIGALMQTANAVIYPALADPNRSDSSVAAVAGLLVRCAWWTGLPICIVLIRSPEQVVSLVFGLRWVEAAAMVPLASVFTLAVVLRQTTGMIVLSRVNPGVLLVVELGVLAGMGVILFVFDGNDLLDYLVMVTSVCWLAVFLLKIRLMREGLLSLSDQARMMLSLVVSTSLSVACLEFLSHYLPGSLPMWMTPVMELSVTMLCFLLVLRLLDHLALARLLDYLPGATMWRRVLFLDGVPS